ncbi:MerR family transcriptional regulator [Novosphingobium lentum]|uniref:MerR family transcriptional regulator n=1 Tax=Novosphingobium lentum TaxID=145287 RepID=UPI0008334DF5|nr:MerR family transcriptional regulator [Novosphingobium lentum]
MSQQPTLDFPGFHDGPVFDDGKEPGALRTIGEVARALGVRQHVLRYWEEQFPMLRPLTRAGGRRYYRTEDIALLGEINRLLYREGFTIRGARQALEGAGRAALQGLQKPVVDEPPVARSAGPDAPITDQLRALRDRLAEALRA